MNCDAIYPIHYHTISIASYVSTPIMDSFPSRPQKWKNFLVQKKNWKIEDEEKMVMRKSGKSKAERKRLGL